ncbi:hypothetical protein SKAU_G00403110 [Synaphobranchus kaupii]|uniref:Uncharacterized protein n=1 Tax=Synaphobranchus kaupii TaxID=118154 RepID=A0A9Q1E9I5_SYNKA|nr:hypothetical protein SKAU_G00403110 [Synaphobranchus kaupii]
MQSACMESLRELQSASPDKQKLGGLKTPLGSRRTASHLSDPPPPPLPRARENRDGHARGRPPAPRSSFARQPGLSVVRRLAFVSIVLSGEAAGGGTLRRYQLQAALHNEPARCPSICHCFDTRVSHSGSQVPFDTDGIENDSRPSKRRDAQIRASADTMKDVCSTQSFQPSPPNLRFDFRMSAKHRAIKDATCLSRKRNGFPERSRSRRPLSGRWQGEGT